MNDKPQNFELIENALSRIDADIEASEAHGMLCGMICATGRGDINAWLAEILNDRDPRDLSIKESQKLLMNLYDQTLEQLSDGNFGLVLLLRNDEEPLDHRIQDLSDWCQGFLYGMAMNGLSDLTKLPDEAREILNDIMDISKAGYDAGEGEEENETAYVEITEYIRVGVLVVYNELNGAPAATENKVLH